MHFLIMAVPILSERFPMFSLSLEPSLFFRLVGHLVGTFYTANFFIAHLFRTFFSSRPSLISGTLSGYYGVFFYRLRIRVTCTSIVIPRIMFYVLHFPTSFFSIDQNHIN
jgi:hypothetical protein